MCIYATREGDHVLFHHEGGVDVGDVDAVAQRLVVAVDNKLSEEEVTEQLLTQVPEDKKEYGAALTLFVTLREGGGPQRHIYVFTQLFPYRQ